jgi:hypothetical protein
MSIFCQFCGRQNQNKSLILWVYWIYSVNFVVDINQKTRGHVGYPYGHVVHFV